MTAGAPEAIVEVGFEAELLNAVCDTAVVSLGGRPIIALTTDVALVTVELTAAEFEACDAAVVFVGIMVVRGPREVESVVSAGEAQPLSHVVAVEGTIEVTVLPAPGTVMVEVMIEVTVLGETLSTTVAIWILLMVLVTVLNLVTVLVLTGP